MKNKSDWMGLIGGGLLILSLFMPWISAGKLSQNAIDIPNGYVLLSLGVIACVIAVISIIAQKTSKASFLYPLLGALSGWILFLNYGDFVKRADRTVNNFPFLSDFVRDLFGAGSFVGIVGCLIMVGSLFFKSEK